VQFLFDYIQLFANVFIYFVVQNLYPPEDRKNFISAALIREWRRFITCPGFDATEQRKKHRIIGYQKRKNQERNYVMKKWCDETSRHVTANNASRKPTFLRRVSYNKQQRSVTVRLKFLDANLEFSCFLYMLHEQPLYVP